MTEIERLRAHNAELLTILREIASLRHSNASAAAMAQSALDTMGVLDLERMRLEVAAIIAALK